MTALDHRHRDRDDGHAVSKLDRAFVVGIVRLVNGKTLALNGGAD